MKTISWCTMFLLGITALAFEKPLGLQQAQETFLRNLDSEKKNPVRLKMRAMQYHVVKTQYDRADEKWYRSYPKIEDRSRIEEKVFVNYYHTLCVLNKSVDDCKKRDTELATFQMVNAVGFRNFTPKVIEIPELDLAAKIFTVAGKTYSLESGDLISSTSSSTSDKPTLKNRTQPSTPVENAAQAYTSTGTKTVKTDENTGETLVEDESNYTCEWSKTTPRKVLRGPGCHASGSRICTGYVTCGTSKFKADRLATCAESLCGENQALSCAKQPGYGSKTAGDSDSTFTNSKKSNAVNGVR